MTTLKQVAQYFTVEGWIAVIAVLLALGAGIGVAINGWVLSLRGL